jgi:phosphoglycerate kinase
MPIRTLDHLVARGKRVLLRADLNVPVKDGRITDLTRLQRLCPTIRELSGKGARVVICSHFGRPNGKRVPEMSLRPVASALKEVLSLKVQFAEACVGPVAEQAVKSLADGEILVLENTRFDSREEKNDPGMARELAALADVYVNDAFSAAHRAHASTEGVAQPLPKGPFGGNRPLVREFRHCLGVQRSAHCERGDDENRPDDGCASHAAIRHESDRRQSRQRPLGGGPHQ